MAVLYDGKGGRHVNFNVKNSLKTTTRVSFRKFSTGGSWRNLDFKGRGMMVKDVTKFHKRYLEGRDMLKCVRVCAWFHTGF